MLESRKRVYYINNIENDVYRVMAEGFDRNTGEKRVIIKNLTDGKRWDLAQKDLNEVRLVDGKITDVWEMMPEGWHPVKEERPYPGYINDPRGEMRNGYNVHGVPTTDRIPTINRFNRERTSFDRR